MSLAVALEDTASYRRPVSPFREMGAYEALWTEKKASFRVIADKFRAHPGALPSDFVPEADAVRYATHAKQVLSDAGVERFGVRVHGAGEYPEKLRQAEHPIEVLYYQGWWDLADSPSIAVVATRNPSEEGKAR